MKKVCLLVLTLLLIAVPGVTSFAAEPAENPNLLLGYRADNGGEPVRAPAITLTRLKDVHTTIRAIGPALKSSSLTVAYAKTNTYPALTHTSDHIQGMGVHRSGYQIFVESNRNIGGVLYFISPNGSNNFYILMREDNRLGSGVSGRDIESIVASTSSLGDHPGAFQIIGDYLFICMSSTQAGQLAPALYMYDLSPLNNPATAEQGIKALAPVRLLNNVNADAATGIVDVNTNFLNTSSNPAPGYKYLIGTFDYVKQQLQLRLSPVVQHISELNASSFPANPDKTFQLRTALNNMALFADTAGDVWLVSFRSETKGRTFDDNFDVWKLTTGGGAEWTPYSTLDHENPGGAVFYNYWMKSSQYNSFHGVHWRYGAGIEIAGDNDLRLYATDRQALENTKGELSILYNAFYSLIPSHRSSSREYALDNNPIIDIKAMFHDQPMFVYEMEPTETGDTVTLDKEKLDYYVDFMEYAVDYGYETLMLPGRDAVFVIKYPELKKMAAETREEITLTVDSIAANSFDLFGITIGGQPGNSSYFITLEVDGREYQPEKMGLLIERPTGEVPNDPIVFNYEENPDGEKDVMGFIGGRTLDYDDDNFVDLIYFDVLYNGYHMLLTNEQVASVRAMGGIEELNAMFRNLPGHWNAEHIQDSAFLGWTIDSMSPDDVLTVGNLAMMLYWFAGEMENNKYDITNINGMAVLRAVHWAYENKLVLGDGVNPIRATNQLTKEQVVVVLDRFFTQRGVSLPVLPPIEIYDMHLVSPWAQESVARFAAAGWLTGVEDGLFNPKQLITMGRFSEVSGTVRNYVDGGTPPEAPNEEEEPEVKEPETTEPEGQTGEGTEGDESGGSGTNGTGETDGTGETEEPETESP